MDSYSLSLDGERVLIRHKDDYTVLDTKADAAKDDDTKKKLDLGHMRMLVEPTAEWAEMFDNAWRLERDLFFSPVMNGQDWKAVHDSYARLLPQLGSREDLNYLIGQVLGEIGNSHTYVGGGDDGDTGPKVRTGPARRGLGARLGLGPVPVRQVIYPGDNTRDAYRSPLAQPGLEREARRLRAGRQRRRTASRPTARTALMQLTDADTTVELTVADSPNGARAPRGGEAGGQAELSVREGGVDRP